MQYSTIGRETYTGMEVKICCARDVDHLNNDCLNERYRIVLISAGSGVFTSNNKSQIIISPAVLCLNERDNVELHATSNLNMDIMYFEPTCFERYVTFENIEAWKHTLNDDCWFFRPFFTRTDSFIGVCPVNRFMGKRISRLIELTDLELTGQKDGYWPCRSRSFFIELLLVANSVYDEGNAHENIYSGILTDEVKEVINWLHIHCLEKITIDTIAKQFYTNKTTLNQKFNAVLGTTVMEFVNSMRVQVACSFLRKTYLPIKEIMERSGYRDDAHFLRSFKKHVGCPPSEYRNRFENI